jgi:hypothetical protein
MWRGETIIKSADYSARRLKLKEFVERHWVPDARLLGGIFTSVAQPRSLEEFAEKGVGAACHSVEFIPEQAGRRRLVWFLEATVRAAEAIPGLKQQRTLPSTGPRHSPVIDVPRTPITVATATVPAANTSQSIATRRVRAVPVDKMPDVYDLFGEDGFPISRASVQQFRVSQQLKDVLAKGGDLWVNARWKPEFGGYEIQGIAPA